MNLQQQFAAKIERGIFNPVKRHLSATAADNADSAFIHMMGT